MFVPPEKQLLQKIVTAGSGKVVLTQRRRATEIRKEKTKQSCEHFSAFSLRLRALASKLTALHSDSQHPHQLAHREAVAQIVAVIEA
jgi:hypothetical protein